MNTSNLVFAIPSPLSTTIYSLSLEGDEIVGFRLVGHGPHVSGYAFLTPSQLWEFQPTWLTVPVDLFPTADLSSLYRLLDDIMDVERAMADE